MSFKLIVNSSDVQCLSSKFHISKFSASNSDSANPRPLKSALNQISISDWVNVHTKHKLYLTQFIQRNSENLIHSFLTWRGFEVDPEIIPGSPSGCMKFQISRIQIQFLLSQISFHYSLTQLLVSHSSHRALGDDQEPYFNHQSHFIKNVKQGCFCSSRLLDWWVQLYLISIEPWCCPGAWIYCNPNSRSQTLCMEHSGVIYLFIFHFLSSVAHKLS